MTEAPTDNYKIHDSSAQVRNVGELKGLFRKYLEIAYVHITSNQLKGGNNFGKSSYLYWI